MYKAATTLNMALKVKYGCDFEQHDFVNYFCKKYKIKIDGVDDDLDVRSNPLFMPEYVTVGSIAMRRA